MRLSLIYKDTLIWDDGVVGIEGYKRKKHLKKDSMALYSSGLFKVADINQEGYVVFEKGGQMLKVLYSRQKLSKFTVGDVFRGTLKKKIFFVYWEWEYIDYIKENNNSGEQQRLEI